MDDSTLSTDKDFVTSLAKGLAVIQAFDRVHPQMTLSEMASAVGYTRATARRFLKTLERLGFVASDGKYFWLTPRILDLGFAYLASRPIVHVVQPFIDKVSLATGESCSVSVLEGQDVVYIARHMTKHIISVNLNIGTRLPAWLTSMGRVLLAGLSPQQYEAFMDSCELTQHTEFTVSSKQALRHSIEAAREDGYAIVNQELEFGLRSIAVPLFNQREQMVAAINVGVAAGRMTKEQLVSDILPHLLQAADDIKALLPG